ncbi:MAG: acetylornithine transaminase [Proteobacteria bacterium]|nr:acetylornithine transaminase [Pseudomonadota bacterium]
MTDPNQRIAARFQDALVGNYAPQPVALVSGEGCHVVDAAGRRYLDLMAGVSTCALGHCHPKLAAALEAQARKLWHVSNHFFTEPVVRAAELICAHSFAEKVFFGNSGTEANEAALKLARRYHRLRGEDRFEFVAFDRGFHGRTLFALSATGTPAYWEGFEPLVPGFRHVSFGDLDGVKAQLSERTAGILVEPIQGEGGVHLPPPGFLEGLRRLADENGCLLLFDEVQTGLGRTGSLFGYQHFGVTPDILTLAKALGNGLPIGAVATTAEIASALTPGSHGTTLGGNPLATAVAAAVLEELTEGGVLERARATAARLAERLETLPERVPEGRVQAVRGVGFLWGIELSEPARPVIDRCRERGVLVIPAGANVLRLAPPVVLNPEEADAGLDVIEEALGAE